MSPTAYYAARERLLDSAIAHLEAANHAAATGDHAEGRRLSDKALESLREANQLRQQHKP